MSKLHKSPGNDSDPFVINPDAVRHDQCSPRQGGHSWTAVYGNLAQTRVGVLCSKCKTTRVQDHTQDRDLISGDFPSI